MLSTQRLSLYKEITAKPKSLCRFHTCLCNPDVDDRSLVLLREVPGSRSEGEAAIILLGHFIDTNSLAIRQPDNEGPKRKDRGSELLAASAQPSSER